MAKTNLFNLIIRALKSSDMEAGDARDAAVLLHEAIRPLIEAEKWADMLVAIECLLSTLGTLMPREKDRVELFTELTARALAKSKTTTGALKEIFDARE